MEGSLLTLLLKYQELFLLALEIQAEIESINKMKENDRKRMEGLKKRIDSERKKLDDIYNTALAYKKKMEDMEKRYKNFFDRDVSYLTEDQKQEFLLAKDKVRRDLDRMWNMVREGFSIWQKYKEAVEEAEEEYKRLERDMERLEMQEEKKLKALYKKKEELEKSLRSMESKIPDNVLRTLKTLLANYNGNAVVGVDPEGKCKGCGKKLSGDLLDKLRKNGSLTFCPECGRILFI